LTREKKRKQPGEGPLKKVEGVAKRAAEQLSEDSY
jgi:hypothetical protein